MERYIAILRGINVGGKRKILMADLRQMFAALGFSQIESYIQSCNVVFSSDKLQENMNLAALVEDEIAVKFGFEVPVVIRSVDALRKLVQNNPFVKNDSTENGNLHLTFLKEHPAGELIEKIESNKYLPDKFVISGQDVYLYCAGKYHQTKLSNNFFESKLNVSATTRNWKTVLRLIELAEI